MAKSTAPAETVKTVKTAEDVRAEIANRPRQSVVRLVEYYVIVREVAPEKINELFGDRAAILEDNVDRVTNPVTVAVEKAAQSQLDMAIKALTNDDEKNGYANFEFDQELFDAKLAPKKTRTKKSVAEKTEDLLAGATEADLEVLAAILRAKGLSL